MNIGFQGLGKLGLMVALTYESRGHKVVGCDLNPKITEFIKNKSIPFKEENSEILLQNTKLKIVTLSEVVHHSDIIFVPIQTPHEEKYEGVTRLPEERVDFNYQFLKIGIRDLADEIWKQGKDKIVIIISTVLPSTIEQEIKPLLNSKVKLCYSPMFIAMGTVYSDTINPEFVLFGADDKDIVEKCKDFFKTIHNAPFFETDITTAEAIKVAYNTFITSKICIINSWMEIAEKTGANIDHISKALSLATDRIISSKYMNGGNGDSGGCHPRDLIALSSLARKLNLSYDLFNSLAICREKQAEWLAKEMCKYQLPKIILGESFKKESNITTGSCSLLIKNILEEFGHQVDIYDPYTRPNTWRDFLYIANTNPAVYLISTQHPDFINLIDYLHQNSIVLDIWRYLKKDNRVRYIGTGT